MITKQINLKPDCPDEVYKSLCETTERQGVFKACGNPNEKWVMVQFEDEFEYFAWILAMTSEIIGSEVSDGT